MLTATTLSRLTPVLGAGRNVRDVAGTGVHRAE